MVAEGYKQTEVGVIPEDWEEGVIGDYISFNGGSQPDKSYFSSSSGKGKIRLIQIRDYKTDKYITYIPEALARRHCDENDIMIGRYGPPVFQILRGIKGSYNVALIKASPKDALVHDYAYYYLKNERLFRFIDKLSRRSSGQTGVDLVELKQYPLPLPPTLAEQEAIAGALSDADGLIESLEQLIEKKRQIKQGAMQELLSPWVKEEEKGKGKKEKGAKPKLKEGWVEKTLGEIFSITAGGDLRVNEYSDTQSPSFSHPIYSNAIGNKGLYGYSSSCDYDSPAITITARGGVGHAEYRDTPFAAIGRLLVLIPKIKLDCRYVCEFIRLHITFSSESTGVPQLTAPQASAYDVKIPPVTEQTRIAAILGDMDDGISALESKLSKAKQIKQGMMQELLTGKTRLI